MDDDGLNMRNWGYYEPSFKEHLGLQLMSPMGDHRDPKPFSIRESQLMVNPNVSTYHHPHTRVVSDPPLPMNYMMRDGWIQRERLLHMLPGNNNFPVIPSTSSSTSHSINMVPPLDLSKDNNNINNVIVSEGEDTGGVGGGSETGDGGSSIKKRGSTTTPKPSGPKKQKKPKKPLSTPRQSASVSGHHAKTIKRNVDVVINGADMDMSGIPIPVCTCTGAPQQCYRWGLGGWQSACCTTTISIYPLPMSTKRCGARIAGRKMSQGAFKKVLEKLASEGYSFAEAIDLRSYWAKHGTNKFVTIR